VCGIVGYAGYRSAAGIVVEGLKKLEYRGYDSFGVATKNNKEPIHFYKRKGRISEAEKDASMLKGTLGIGHTRWATHGVPNDANAHPHFDCQKRIAVVHNGIIENYSELKKELESKGHIFCSETDTEVIAHLLENEYQGDLLNTMQNVLHKLTGSYALLVMAEGDDRIIAARDSSPLVLGVGDGEMFAASDMTPLLDHTERVIFLEDGDIAAITPEKALIYSDGVEVSRAIELIDWTVGDAKKGGFKHFMLKEIYEQPQVFSDTIRSFDVVPSGFANCKGAMVVACGTSYHAGMIFKYLLEETCQIPARLELGSEFKYFTPPVTELVIGITQSGETADTLAALKKAKAYNCPTLAITNVLGSTVTRVADETLYMRAGPEISVAATKSFIAELAILMQCVNHLSGGKFSDEVLRANRAIEEVLLLDLSSAVQVCNIAEHIFFVGRGPFYAVALEGALKMKEISYIHAEGYAAGEIKHGPFALLSPKTPVVAICTPGTTYGVMISNIKEMKARGTPVVVIGVVGDDELADIADVYIGLPKGGLMEELLMVTVILQLLAYRTADSMGRDIDKPRNLAKSVTVE
jgi:glucosamine--fructose-6-phosphate aminotransferase (isomerizing)